MSRFPNGSACWLCRVHGDVRVFELTVLDTEFWLKQKSDVSDARTSSVDRQRFITNVFPRQPPHVT